MAHKSNKKSKKKNKKTLMNGWIGGSKRFIQFI